LHAHNQLVVIKVVTNRRTANQAGMMTTKYHQQKQVMAKMWTTLAKCIMEAENSKRCRFRNKFLIGRGFCPAKII